VNPLLNVLQRLGALFHRWPGVVRICHGLVGADRRLLARAPKPEQTAHTAMGVLMLLAALWTGVGMSLKVGAALSTGPGWLLHAVLFVFFAALSLGMEVVVLSTLKPGRKNLIALRLVMSLTLVCLQVLPLAVMAFQGRIDLELHKDTLTNVAAAQGLSAKARGLDTLQAKAKDLQSKADQAQRSLQSPGAAPQAVVDAEAAVGASQAKVTQANKALEDARRRAANLRAKLGDPKLPDEQRVRIEGALKSANERILTRQGELNAADAAAENARSEHAAAQRAWRASLEAGAKEADDAVRVHEAAVAQAAGQQASDVARAEQLAGRAHTSAFFTSLGKLFELAIRDVTVLLPLLFCALVAGIIDLLPLATKVELLNGVHARGTATREAVETERLNLYRDQARLMAAEGRLQAQQRHDAMAKWVEADQGATQAQEYALEAQQRLDRSRLNASAELITAHAEVTRAALENLREVQALAEANPALGSVWRSQLAALIEALAPGDMPTKAAAAPAH